MYTSLAVDLLVAESCPMVCTTFASRGLMQLLPQPGT